VTGTVALTVRDKALDALKGMTVEVAPDGTVTIK
jgi:hypothetical protein